MDYTYELKQKIQEIWNLSNKYEINTFNKIVEETVVRLEQEIKIDIQEGKNEKGFLKYFEIDLKKQGVTTALELKIINEYRNLEIYLTRLLIESYNLDESTKFLNWDSFFNFLKEKKNIRDIKQIDGYQEANQLKKTVSVLKHSIKKLTEDARTKDILEFKENGIYETDSLKKFYDRVRPQILIFAGAYADKIVENLRDTEKSNNNK